MIHLQCGCGQRIRLPESHIGKAASCRSCNQVLRAVATDFEPQKDDWLGTLVIRRGPSRKGEHIFLGGRLPIEIGKLPGVGIALGGKKVSRTHCRLTRTDFGWRIEDQNSTNGLFANGRRVTTHDLSDGDVLRIGEFTLKYLAASPAHYVDDAISEAAAAPPPVPPKPGPPPVSIPIRPAIVPPPVSRPVETASSPPPVSRPVRPAPKPPPVPTDAARAEQRRASASAGPAAPTPDDDAGYSVAEADDELYVIADDDLIEPAASGENIDLPATPDVPGQTATEANGEGPICPCCERTLPPRAKICVQCGINVKTGRSILTAEEHSLDAAYAAAERVIRWLSWLIWFGIYPIASEALGSRKPYVVRALAVITIVTSAWFWTYLYAGPERLDSVKDLMLWAGDPDLEPELPAFLVEPNHEISEEEEEFLREMQQEVEDAGLEPAEYRPYQLITHAFLHGGLLHLASNLLFLMVFGSRINALLGQIGTVIVYPLLAIGGGLAHALTSRDLPIHPMLGASGAIMGLAGMYFVFFPIHKVHMAAWWRLGLIFRFRLSLRMWPARGFWVVLFYIAFDILWTALGVETGVAHWAHLGGFIVGAVIALILLFTRLVNCRGGDLVSAILGKHAWALVGRPNRTARAG